MLTILPEIKHDTKNPDVVEIEEILKPSFQGIVVLKEQEGVESAP